MTMFGAGDHEEDWKDLPSGGVGRHKKEETRIDLNTGQGSSTHVGTYSGDSIVTFEVHIDPTTRKIVTSRFMCGKNRYLVQQVGARIVDELQKKYGFGYRNLIVLSSDEPDGIWVWVKSRVPIPPPKLTGSSLLNPADSVIDVTAYENHPHRLKDNPKLLSPNGDDQVIDI